MSGIVIELLKDEDLEEASEFMRSVISHTPYYNEESKVEMGTSYTVEKIRLRKNDSEFYQPYIVAKDESRIVGFADGYADAGVFWGNWLGVHNNYRRQGLAQRLKETLEGLAKAHGCHKYWCDTRTDNIESNSLQTKLGYSKVGLLKDYWYHMDFYIWDKQLV